MKVLVLDGVSQKGIDILKEPGFDVVAIEEKLSEDKLVEMIGDYDAMIVRSATKVTARIMESATKLKIIGRAGVGVDNIDINAATQKGIIVVNAPDGNTIAAAEQTMALILALSRFVPIANEKLKQGKWLRKEYVGVELRDKVLGVVGLGRIGTAVAKRAQGFEMKTIGYDAFLTEEKAKANGIKLVSLEEVFRKSDFITVHLPLTKETKYMINTETFRIMKDGVRIINVARGGIVSEKDLYEALVSGKVAGAAIDVFEAEPTTESPLFSLDNVVVTPHLGASTEEAQVNVALDVAEDIVGVLQGEMAKNAVNMPAIPAELMEAVKPYLELGEKLGSFAGQVAADFKTIEVTYAGEISNLNVAPITTAVLKGVLSTQTDEPVNFINASIIAKAKGINVVEAKKSNEEDYSNLIKVTVSGGKCSKTVGGSLFRNNDARIVIIDGFHVDAIPAGHMLVAPHMDKPKIIGKVGSLIGEHNINIAFMQVGREKIGGQAVMVLGVDSLVPDATLAEITKIDGIKDVKFVTL